MTLFQRIWLVAMFGFIVALIHHTHEDITAIQVKLEMLDEKGRLLPEYKLTMERMLSRLKSNTAPGEGE